MIESPYQREKIKGIVQKPAGSGIWWINYYDVAGGRHREKIGSRAHAIAALAARRSQIDLGMSAAPKRRRSPTLHQLIRELAALEQNPRPRGIFQKPPGSGIWWIDDRDATGKRHREQVGSRVDAIEIFEEIKLRVHFGLPTGKTQGTFGELVDRLFKHKEASGSSSSGSDRYRARAAVRVFGKMLARDIDAKMIGDFLGSLTKKASTLNRYRASLSSVFRHGMRIGWLTRNPVTWAPGRYQKATSEPRVLLPAEEKSLRTAVQEICPQAEPILDLALETGLRRKEQLALKWADIDLADLTLSVNGRKVPLSASARAAIEKLHVSSNGSELVCSGYPDEPAADWFRKSVRKADIGNFAWSNIRHTFAARAAKTVDLATLSQILGQKTSYVVELYSRFSPLHLRALVGKGEERRGHKKGWRAPKVEKKIWLAAALKAFGLGPYAIAAILYPRKDGKAKHCRAAYDSFSGMMRDHEQYHDQVFQDLTPAAAATLLMAEK